MGFLVDILGRMWLSLEMLWTVFGALYGMAKGKAPGSDGFPMEFYVAFWDVLGPDLVEVLNASLDLGSLPFSQRGALISLIFMKEDRLLHKNWRSISLLNVDYKLCARALAGHLLKVLHHVVHSDHTCGVRGRYIGENVALLRDIMRFTEETNFPAVILSLDQEKEFDRVDWNFLVSTLDLMGFGPSSIAWVNFCTRISAVPSLSMATLVISFGLCGACNRGVPSLLFCMSYPLRSWRPIFVLAPLLRELNCLEFLTCCRCYRCTPMIPLSYLPLIMPLELCLKPMGNLRRALVPS